jgi:hypothetical protein
MRQSIVLKLFIIIVAGVAAGGAMVWGFVQSKEVRGESAGVAGPGAVPEAATTLREEDAAGYFARLRADDYTTYTHPGYGFSVDVPKEFERFRTTTADKDHTVFRHPRLPLGINVYVRPVEGSEESETRVAFVTSLSADYDAEPPEGADGEAAALMAQDDPYPGQYTWYFWFAYQQQLYEIQLHAPDRELLEFWARQFLYSDFTLPSQ